MLLHGAEPARASFSSEMCCWCQLPRHHRNRRPTSRGMLEIYFAWLCDFSSSGDIRIILITTRLININNVTFDMQKPIYHRGVWTASTVKMGKNTSLDFLYIYIVWCFSCCSIAGPCFPRHSVGKAERCLVARGQHVTPDSSSDIRKIRIHWG